MAMISYEEMKKMIRLDTYREIAEEYEAIVDEGIEHRWNNVSKDCEGTGFDPADMHDDVIEILRMFKYRMQLMIICCLCETWEQDLYNFLKEEQIITNESNKYGRIKSKFDSNFPNSAISKFDKLDEMRTFVNSVKHGKGDSFDKLFKKLKDSILADSNIGIMNDDGTTKKIKQNKFDSNTLTSITLNPDGKIKEYYDEIIRFWESVFSDMKK